MEWKDVKILVRFYTVDAMLNVRLQYEEEPTLEMIEEDLSDLGVLESDSFYTITREKD